MFNFVEKVFKFAKFPDKPYNYAISIALFLTGAFWMVWATTYLVYRGEGSPIEAFGKAIEPTKKIVKTGPFKYTRNPMMFGFFVILLGMAVFFRTLAGALLVPLIALGFIVYWRVFEERYLLERFGREYIEYKKETPVLIPALILKDGPNPAG
jgi:protein-S-isoprenylcysteine O-methyltransferase Ste14